MKFKFLFLLFILFISIVFISCSKNDDVTVNPQPLIPTDSLGGGWTKIPMPEAEYTDIFFADNSNGYLVDKNGNIYRSINAGLNWDTVYRDPTSYCYNIGMKDANNAMFTFFESVLYTMNGGQSFQPHNFNTSVYDCIYLANGKMLVSGINGIYISQDGGNTFGFTKIVFNRTEQFNGLFFLNNNIGWFITNDSLYKTIDGAISWQPLCKNEQSRIMVDFYNENIGYKNNTLNTISKSTNGGMSWVEMGSLYSASHSFPDIDFVDATTGFAVEGEYIYKTSDGGITWQKSLRSAKYIIETHFIDANHGWACGKGGVYRYNN